jgi:hypothetical protein
MKLATCSGWMCFATACAATTAFGQVSYVSDDRSVSLLLIAQGIFDPTDLVTDSLVPGSPFSGFTATLQDTAQTSEARATGRATQISTLSFSEFTCSAQVSGAANGDSFAGEGISSPGSNFSVRFQVDTAVSVRVVGSLTLDRANGFIRLVQGESTILGVTTGSIDQTVTIEPGEYTAYSELSMSLLSTTSTGQSGSGSLDVTYTFTATGCRCPADFDGSGGTPDVSDIDAFFTAWLAGDPLADADCSGGTPDVGDIDVFFTAWLAGEC